MYSFLFEQVGKYHNLENKSQKKDMKTAKKKQKKSNMLLQVCSLSSHLNKLLWEYSINFC